MPLDADTVDTLEKVKRGTPAKFVLLSKGIRAINLVVFRRGTVDSATRLARKAGQGDVAAGVVDGQGQNITFKLARSDGYEKPPTTNLALKALLAESNIDSKPTIEIVDALPEVQMEDAGGPKMPQQMPPMPPVPKNPQVPQQQIPKTPPVPQQQVQRAVYRTQGEWDAVLNQIRQATDDQTKNQRFTQAVDYLKAERAQAQTDRFVAADPNLKILVDGVHVRVAQELKTLSPRPLPPPPGKQPTSQQPPPQLQPPNQGGPPRQLPPQPPPQQTKPSNQGGPPTQPPPQPPSQKPPNQGGPPQQSPPQPPPQQTKPTSQGGPPQGQQRTRKTQKDVEREQMASDVQRRIESLEPIVPPYNKPKMRAILAECETDAESDFGKVAAGLMVDLGHTFEQIRANLEGANTAALKYIKDHPDPKLGKLPERVLQRRQHCKIFLQQIDPLLEQLDNNETHAKALLDTYSKLLQDGELLPFGVGDEIRMMLAKTKVSQQTEAALRQLADDIQAPEPQRGYDRLAKLQNPTELEKAEILLSHGCQKLGGGGSSDVRLLRNPDGSIAFAFKGARGEAVGALSMLKLPNGASATREDMCSTLNQEILRQTGIDFGFPKAQAVNIAGQTGALIEGIRGKTVDAEERSKMLQDHPEDVEGIAELGRRLKEIPEKVTPQSLQKVLLYSTLSCQWDFKWGNMMVEGETNARPIDGGGAFPTQDAIDDLGRDKNVKTLPFLALTQYPQCNFLGKLSGQTLPQAQVPMDDGVVKGILSIDVQALTAKMKSRRDEITRDIPDLAPPPHDVGLIDDATFGRVVASIQAAQNILRQNPKQSLVDFATAYEQWWLGWITANRRPRNQT